MKSLKKMLLIQTLLMIVFLIYITTISEVFDKKIHFLFILSFIFMNLLIISKLKSESNFTKKEELPQLLKLNQREHYLTGEQEEIIYNKIRLIVETFENMHKLSKKDYLKKVFDSAFELITEAEKGSFFEFDGDKYVPILSKGYDFETLMKLSFKKDVAFIGFEYADNPNIEAYETYISERDSSKFSKEIIEAFKELGTYSGFTSLYAPIQVDGNNVGMICLENFNKIGFKRTSKKILKHYAQLISHFYSQRIYQEKKTKFYKDTVTALASAIEIKDIYTEGHGQRVQEYSCLIAQKMNLSMEQIENIKIASLLHDIGKIGIPIEILHKPGPLTKDEYETIKLHPEYSKKILENIDGFSKIVELAYAHHEHYDGSGYPLGLKGKEIPIEAHIIQLADAYDAMTSERSYRKAMSKEKAIEVIRNGSGKQFHPDIAKIAVEDVFTLYK